MENTIEVKGLTKAFDDKEVVKELNFTIKKGQIFGFLGPNGSGKSTTIRMLCGILTPTSGEGQVLGHGLHEGEKIKQEIGYMSQKFSLYEDLTVMENIKFYGQIYGITGKKLEARVNELLDRADLKDRVNQLAGNLSGGWKQRLALVCAILHRPKLVFLDEPTAGVDPVSRRIFWEMIKDLAREEEVTVLVTTHYMDEAERCDVVGFIFQGELLEFDNPQGILKTYGRASLEDVFIDLVQKV